MHSLVNKPPCSSSLALPPELLHCVALRCFFVFQDGFDLDIAYVTKRIIVHGVPNVSAGMYSMTRVMYSNHFTYPCVYLHRRS